MKFQQNLTITIQDLKMHTIPNLKGGVSTITLSSGQELPQQSMTQSNLRPINAESKPKADSQLQVLPLPFLAQTVPRRRSEANEDLLKIMKNSSGSYACIKGGVETGGVVSALIKHEDVTAESQRVLPKKCQDLSIYSIPCTIGDYTFTNAMLDLGASINVMPSSIYKSLNFGDLEPTKMIIYIVQPLGILEDVLVQVNELIFPTDFYMLDMEDEVSRKGSTLILGRSFFMTAGTKIDVHVRTLSMEFGDNLAMKHPTKDHSIFSIDILDKLVE
ncbi:hypothetical protein CR513_37089, partial [Mucuna pruriens]